MPRPRRGLPSTAVRPSLVCLLGVLAVLCACSSSGTPSPSVSPTAPAGTVGALPASTVVAFLGDSYTQGAGTSDLRRRWSTLVTRVHGWIERNAGVGGSGYLAGAPYADRAVAVAALRPTVVVVSGGLNDLAAASASPAAEAGAVDSTFAALRQALPNAVLVAVRPFYPAAAAPPTLAVIAGDVRSAVGAVGGTYLDVGNPLAGRTRDIAPDHVHPDDAGHRALAEAVTRALDRTPVPR